MLRKALPELTDAAVAALPSILLIAAAVLVIGVVGWWAGRKIRPGWNLAAWLVLLTGATAFGLWLSWSVAWLADDAFISFRYASNLLDGHGLVFNPEEWVEGYTNFLWTFALTGVGLLGGSIPAAGLYGNLLAFVLVLWVSAWIVRKASPRPGVIPWASVAMAGSLGFVTFATSGLETMPAALLIMCGVWATLGRRPLVAGFVFVLAALARPDHLLFWGSMGLAMALEDAIMGQGRLLKRLDWKRYAYFAAPLLLVWLPYFLLRWSIYGSFFPNTYYAKSGGLTYWSQGSVYLGVTLVAGGAWLWLLAYLVMGSGRARSRNEIRMRLFALLAMATHGVYVVKVGGDFMAHRFFIVYWPIVLTALELSLRWRLDRPGWVRRGLLAPLGAIAIAAALAPVDLIKPFEKKWHVAQEHTFYRLASGWPVEVASNYERRGRHMSEIFAAAEIKPRLSAECVGMIGWHNRDLVVIDAFGLTNERVAHKPLKNGRRGRPGHEKHADIQDVLADNAELSTVNFWGAGWSRYTKATFGKGTKVYFLRELPELRRKLKRVPGVRLPSSIVPVVRRASQHVHRADAVDDWRFLSQFASEKHAAGMKKLEARLGEIAIDFEFELPGNALVSGDAPALKTGRMPTGGSGEGWLHLDGKGTRELRIPVDLREHAELRFSLGGTKSADHRIELEVSDRVVRSATPDGSSKLRPHAWKVDDVGEATLVIVDNEPAKNAMFVLDAIYVPGKGDILERLKTTDSAHDELSLLAAAESELPADHEAIKELRSKSEGKYQRWDFEAPKWPADANVEGGAFGRGPVAGRALDAQGLPSGQRGQRFANSFHGGDVQTGRVVLPEFEIPSGGVLVRVGGGSDCQKVYVGLEVNGKIIARRCGQNDETLRLTQLPAGRHAGKTGRVVIVDEAKGGWGHILVDDVVVPRNSSAPNQAHTESSGRPMRLNGKLGSRGLRLNEK